MAPSRRGKDRTGHEDALTLALKGASISAFDFSTIVTDLVMLKESDFRELASYRPALRSRTTVMELIRHAHALLSSAPNESLILTELAIRIASCMRPVENDPAEISHARGRAWQERTAALIECGEMTEASQAADEADRFYAESNVVRADAQPSLALLRARMLSECGETEEALRIADDAARLFLTTFEDRRRYLIARVFCANILVTMQRYPEALTAYDNASEIAEELEDTDTHAHVVHMVGNTLSRIGHHEGAREAFAMAIEMFEALRKPVEIARIRIRMGIGMLTRGEYNEGIAELGRSREEFLRLNMPVVAAQAGLEMVNGMLLAKRYRWIEPLCREMIETFNNARLPREAQKALAYLKELASATRGRLRSDDVVFVQGFLQRLENDPSVAFTPPAKA